MVLKTSFLKCCHYGLMSRVNKLGVRCMCQHHMLETNHGWGMDGDRMGEHGRWVDGGET